MGQATSTALAHKSKVFIDYDDFSSRFSKVAISTATAPLVIIAFPILNAYTFTENEMTGVRMMDGVIGGLLGVIGWPLAPFMACWSTFQILFNDGPPAPAPVSEETKAYLRTVYGMNCETFYNVAFVGCSGTGKSSLLNGITGFRDDDNRAAKTGESETTREVQAFRHPDLKSLILWDMPGGGTIEHPADTYFDDMVLYAFDTLVIVFSDRFTELDINIAKRAKQYRIPFVFVRNKADQAMEAKLRKQPTEEENDLRSWSVAAGELVQEVKKSVWTQLKANHISTRTLFIVSAWNLQSFVDLLDNENGIKNKQVRLIDEERFVRRVVEGVLFKRKRLEKKKKKGLAT